MSVNSLNPIGNNILVLPDSTQKQSKGGIVLPDVAQDKTNTGVVVGVGSGTMLKNGTLIPMTVKTQDRVAFPRYGHHEIEIDGVMHLVMPETEVMGVIS
jgi:chaperonin GroES